MMKGGRTLNGCQIRGLSMRPLASTISSGRNLPPKAEVRNSGGYLGCVPEFVFSDGVVRAKTRSNNDTTIVALIMKYTGSELYFFGANPAGEGLVQQDRRRGAGQQ